MKKNELRLVIDNTNIITDQLFSQPMFVTRDEMKKLREGFDEWMCPLCEMGIPLNGRTSDRI